MDEREQYEVFPLSDMQESYLTGKCMGDIGEGVGCHVYCEIEENCLDIKRLNEAWNRLIQLHDMLCVKIEEDGVQYFKESEVYRIETYDMTGRDHAAAEEQILNLRCRMSHKVYQVDDYPLYEICVTYRENAISTIHFSMDEWIADAASISLLFKQWYQLYHHPESKINKIDYSFKDFMKFQRERKESKKYKEDYRYWIDKLKGMNQEIPWFFKSQTVVSKKRSRYLNTLDSYTWNRIKEISAQHRVSATATVLTCFLYTLTMFRVKNNTPLIMTYFNRLPVHENIDQIIGPFITTMIFLMTEKEEFDIKKDSFWEEVKQTQNQIWEDNDHSSISGVQVLRELKRKKMLNKGFTVPMVFTSVINNINKEETYEGTWYDQITYNITQTPQVYLDHQLFETNGSLEIHWDVMEDAFEPDSIGQMFQFYGKLLTQLGKKQYPLPIKSTGNPEFGLTSLQRSYAVNQMSEPVYASQRMIYQEFIAENDSVRRIIDAWSDILWSTPVLKLIMTEEQTQKELNIESNPLQVLDFKSMTESRREEELERIRVEMESMIFPFDIWPKYDLRIIELSDSRIQVNLAADPFIIEGKSLALIYNKLFGKGEKRDETAASFGDYIYTMQEYAKTEEAREEREYWNGKFKSIPDGPFADLVTNHIKKEKGKRSICRVSAKIDGYKALEDYAKKLGCTVESVLLAAYMNVLQSAAGKREFTVLNVSWERIETIPPVEDTIGEFTVMSWITFPSDANSFEAQVIYIEKAMQDDFAHNRVSGLDGICRKHPMPVFPAVFTGIPKNMDLPDSISLGKGLSVTPFVYLDNVSFIEHGSLQINWDYDSDVFDALFIEPLFLEYQKRLEMLCESKDKEAELIWETIAKQAEKYPGQIAVKCGQDSITYRELDCRSSQIARYLIKKGIKSESLVGICMYKSIEMIVAIVSILKAGGAYVPLDPGYPKERLDYIIDDSRLKLILTTQDSSIEIGKKNVQIISIDAENEAILKESDDMFHDGSQSGEQSAYIIYTSGSTGKPKGVVVTHKNVLRLFSQTEKWFDFSQNDIWTMYHSFAFDFSVWEIWGALFYGGTLIVVPFELSRSFERFYHLLSEEKVTVLSQTPTAFKQLMRIEAETGVKELDLRYVIFGGEALNLNSLKDWYKNHGEMKPLLVNMYGITETTVHVTYRPIYKKDTDTCQSLIGEPIPDLKIYLLDEKQNKVETGEVGEICVSGPGLARGYLYRPDITAKHFISNPFEKGERLYLSGDLGRYTKDGDIEYMGRRDRQVKIRGFRIELGEIENALMSYEHITQAAVVAEEVDGELVLHAFIITDGTSVLNKTVRKYVREKLPVYMVPSKIDVVDFFPMTVNGKLDSRLLNQAVRGENSEIEAPSKTAIFAETNKTALDIIKHELHESEIALEEDLFDLGATSLTIVTISKKIQNALGVLIPVEVFLDMPVVEDLLSYLDNKLLEQNSCGKESIKKEHETVSVSEEGLIIPLEENETYDVIYQKSVPTNALKREKIAWEDFSRMLSIYQRKDVRNKGRYLYASAGGKNAVQVYIYVKKNKVERVAEGIYYYHPQENAIYHITDGKEINASIYPDVFKNVFEEAGFAIFYIAQLKAIEPVYMGFSSSLVQLDCGYMEELLLSNEEDLPFHYAFVEGIDFAKAARAFKLQEGHLFLGSLLGGISCDEKYRNREKPLFWMQFANDFGNLTEEKIREINSRMEYKQLSKKEVLDLARKKLHLRKDLNGIQKILLNRNERSDWRYLKRSSKRSYLDEMVRGSQLSGLLALLSCRMLQGEKRYLYTSLGDKYLVKIYIYVKEDGVEGISEGIYLYQPESHSLKTIEKVIDTNVGYCHTPFNRPQYKESKFNIYFIVDLEEAQKEYREGYLKYVFTEAGIMGQLLMDHQSDFELGLVPIGGMNFDKISHMFKIGERAMLLHSFMGGSFAYDEMRTDSDPFKEMCDIRENAENHIAVIGMSGRYPGADSIEEYWNNLVRNTCEITVLTGRRKELWNRWDRQSLEKQGYYAGWLESIDQFDYEFFQLSPAEAKYMDPQERIMLEIVWECLERSGYTAESLKQQGVRIGVFIGTMWGDYEKFGIDKWEEDHIIEEVSLHSSIANRISYFFDFHGPSVSVQTACSSSMTALHMACSSIASGECDIAIAGGVSLISHPYHLEALKSQGILTEQGKVNIYSDSHSGMAVGEGAGAVLLKKTSNARKDNDTILATIIGTRLSDYGRAKRYGMVNVDEQKKLFLELIKKCKLEPSDIKYIEAAATGLAISDMAEVQALSSVFEGAEKNSCILSSVKANIGHLEAASFIAQLQKVVLEMQNSRIVEGIFDSKAEEMKFMLSPFRLATEHTLRSLSEKEQKIQYALINSFGAYGAIGSTILECAVQKKGKDTGENAICMISARTWEQLKDYMEQLIGWMEQQDEVSIRDIAYTLARREHNFSIKAAFIVSAGKQLLYLLKQLKERGVPSGSFCMDINGIYQKFEHSNNDLHKAAWEWIDKQDDSIILKKTGKGYMIHLPTCPFKKQSCWNTNRTAGEKLIYVGKNSEEVLRYVIETYAEISEIEPENLDPDRNLEDYGLTSLIITKFNKKLRDDFQISSATLLFEARTLRELAELLSHKDTSFDGNKIRQKKTEAASVNMKTELAVIGLSGIYPGADDVYELWENLVNKEDSITEIDMERWDTGKYCEAGVKGKAYAKWGGFVNGMDQFDPLFFHISPREAELMDPQERKFLEVAYHTFEDAGYTADVFNQQTGHEVGVFVGNMFNDYLLYSGKIKETEGYVSTGTVSASISNRVSYIMNFQGPSMTVNTMCSSALTSLQLAVDSILNGTCKAALVGGVNLIVHPNKYMMHCQNHMLSTDGKCKAFGEGGDGFVPAEGVGAILIRPLKDALSSKDHIYGVIRGIGINHDGRTNGYMVPNPAAQKKLVQKVLEESNVNPETIQYAEAHGTGTRLGDPIEIRGLMSAFQNYTDKKNFCAIGSIKANIGHCEGAAGIASITKVLLQMKYQKFVPNLYCKQLNPEIDFENSAFYLPQEVMDWNADGIRRASVSSFGSGGSNGYAILEEYKQAFKEIEKNEEMILVFSAHSKNDLQKIIKKTYDFLSIRLNYNSKDAAEEELTEIAANIIHIEQVNISKTETFLELGFTWEDLKELKKQIEEKWNYFAPNEAILMNQTIQELSEEFGLKENNQTEYTLRNIAYTLLLGRKKMEEGIVFVCSNEKQLLIQMKAFCKDAKESGIYHDAAGLQEHGENGIFALAADWFSESLDADEVERCFPYAIKVSLPGYPFGGKKYWVETEGYESVKKSLEEDYETIWIDSDDEETVTLKEEAEKKVYNILSHILKIDKAELVKETELSSYGIDSICVMDLCDALNKEFDISFSVPKLLGCKTCGELADEAGKIIQVKQKQSSESSRQKKRIPVRRKKNAKQSKSRDIAIIGIAGIAPGAGNVEDYWSILLRNEDRITPCPKDRTELKEYIALHPDEENLFYGGYLDNIRQWDPLYYNISPSEANVMDPQQRLFLDVAIDALSDANYTVSEVSGSRMGVFVGTGSEEYGGLMRKYQVTGAHSVLGESRAIIANRLSYFLDVHGPSETVDTACASSIVAIHRAVKAIRNQECDMAVAGGIHLMLTPEKFIGYKEAGMLTEQKSVHVFSEDSDGFLRSEGIGCIILKDLQMAERDQDRVYGVIKGSAVNHSGKTLNITIPDLAAQKDVMMEACKDAGIDPGNVQYVEAQGTGAKQGDMIEWEALSEIYGRNEQQFAGISAMKPNFGHMESAYGMFALFKVLYAMKNHVIPAVIGCGEVNKMIEKSGYIIRTNRNWNIESEINGIGITRIAAIHSYGIGGVNAHMIVEEYRKTIPDMKYDEVSPNQVVIFLSAATQEGLVDYVKDIFEYVKKSEEQDVCAFAYTLHKNSTNQTFRTAFCVQGKEQMSEKLAELAASDDISWIHDISKTQDIINKLLSEEDIAILVENAVKTEHYGVILKLWENGVNIHWKALYGDKKLKELPVPTQKSAKKEYWVCDKSDDELKESINVFAKTSTTAEDLIDMVQTIIDDKEIKINPSSPLTQYGFDSIMLMRLKQKIEERYKIKILGSEIQYLMSVNQIMSLIEQKAKVEGAMLNDCTEKELLSLFEQLSE